MPVALKVSLCRLVTGGGPAMTGVNVRRATTGNVDENVPPFSLVRVTFIFPVGCGNGAGSTVTFHVLVGGPLE